MTSTWRLTDRRRLSAINRATPYPARNSRIAPADAWAATLAPTIKKLRAAGITTLQGIARELNRRGIRTSRGKKRWQAIQVRRVLERL
jgi:hypothetical protein